MIRGKCCIFGGGSLYRLPVYNLMAETIDCDFYIGVEKDDAGIKSYDYSKLKNFKGEVQHKKLGNFFWQKGAMKLWWRPYEYYFVGGAYCITSWLMLLLSLFSKKKVVSWSHGMYGRETGLRKWIKAVFFKSCYQCLVYNQRGKELMVECGVNENKIHVVYNSLDTEHDWEIRKKLQPTNLYKVLFNEEYPNMVFVGRVTQEKRLDLALRAIKKLKEKGKPVNFLVVGKDVDGVKLKDRAAVLGISDLVYLYGPCYEEEKIGEMFYNADVCVSPGNVGLTAISSLTFGCPVITHNNFSYQGPEFEAVQPGVTGDFFKQGDADDLAVVIEKWTYSKQPEERENIITNAFKEVDEKWNIYSEVEVFHKLYGNGKK